MKMVLYLLPFPVRLVFALVFIFVLGSVSSSVPLPLSVVALPVAPVSLFAAAATFATAVAPFAAATSSTAPTPTPTARPSVVRMKRSQINHV